MSTNLRAISVELTTIANKLWDAGKLNPEARTLERIVKALAVIQDDVDMDSKELAKLKEGK